MRHEFAKEAIQVKTVKRFAFGCFISFALVTGSPTHAAIFGAAGNDRCGVGTMIFGSGQSISSQSSEESSNSASSGTSSVTTGTSGCKSSGIVKATAEEIHYANINYEELQLECAQGKGEILTGFAVTMGCSKGSESQFAALVQKNYDKIFLGEQSNPNEMLMNLKSLLEHDSLLALQCARKEG